MKYNVTTTTADHVNGHEYNSARAAITVYNNIRALYSRLGYTLADAGRGRNSRAELWIKDGSADRNIEIWPVAPTRAEAETPDTIDETAAPAAGTIARAARVFLLALTLTAAPAADLTTDETPAEVAEIYTADPLAEVAALQAAGLTVAHVTIKSTPTGPTPAADVPALLTC